ncbi:MAG: GtrA family protein [Clostridiales bacterium]|nr:GtrA family protein [Clostridiales bacterium]
MQVSTLLYGSDELTVAQEKKRQAIMYALTGVVSFLVNSISFIVFDKLVVKSVYVTIIKWSFDAMLYLNQGLSWFLSMLAAYVLNRIFVFRSQGHVVRELIHFISLRFLTFLLISEGLFTVVVMFTEYFVDIPRDTNLITLFGVDLTVLYLLKGLNGLIVVAANYMLSILVVFKERKDEGIEQDTCIPDGCA